MTNKELTYYIKRYIEKDRTNRAIMLIGPWGSGKSYYIKNTLIPFLEMAENGEHQCIVISLYGLSNLDEVSKAIYLETRLRKLRIESEAVAGVRIAAKTIAKGIAGWLGVNLSVDGKDLQELYESINLAGKVIIFEDVERTKINILDFLGFVNSLTEQDNVKVLIVANEAELIKYEPNNTKESSDKKNGDLLAYKVPNTLKYTEETSLYFATKEKSIADTIVYNGDLKSAVISIINSFDNNALREFGDEESAQDIVDIMYLLKSENLRSVIFACQKTANIFDDISNTSDYSKGFLRTILYGIVAFSLRLHAGHPKRWVGLTHFSSELGLSKYPLFRFCFDYIIWQHYEPSSIPDAYDAYIKRQLYDREKTQSDKDLQAITYYHIHTEEEVRNALRNITERLRNPDEISFYDYGKIAYSIIQIKALLGVEIKEIKDLLVDNLKGRGEYIKEDDLFWHVMTLEGENERREFFQLRDDMLYALNMDKKIVPQFDYLPEQASEFYDYVVKNSGYIYEAHGFAKFLDIKQLVKMFFDSTPFQMDKVRASFVSIYRPNNIKDNLGDDLSAIDNLVELIETKLPNATLDKIQHMQCQWFLDDLKETINKLM